MIMFYVAIVVFLGLLIFVARTMLFSQANSQLSEVARQLRTAVLARQTGQLDAEEFHHQQHALHDTLINIPVNESKRQLYWSIPVCIFTGMLAIYSFFEQENLDPLLVAETASKIQIPSKPREMQAKPSQNPTMGGDLNTLAARLAKKMEQDPKNGDGWLLLARTFGELRKPAEAATAYEKAADLLSPDPALLADWLDARVTSSGNQWDQKSKAILQKALKTDAKNVKILSLAATASYSENDYIKAKQYWSTILTIAAPQSKDYALAELNMKEADSKQALTPLKP